MAELYCCYAFCRFKPPERPGIFLRWDGRRTHQCADQDQRPKGCGQDICLFFQGQRNRHPRDRQEVEREYDTWRECEESWQPSPHYGSAHQCCRRLPSVVRKIWPWYRRCVCHPGWDLPGDRRQAEAEAFERGEGWSLEALHR